MEFTLDAGIFREMKSRIVSTKVAVILYAQLNPMLVRNITLWKCVSIMRHYLTFLFVFLRIVTLTSLARR